MDGIHIHVTMHAKTYTNTNIIFDDTLVVVESTQKSHLSKSKDIGLKYYFDKYICIV